MRFDSVVCALGHGVFHEWYIISRADVRHSAEAFSIGFGREIVGWTDRQGTRWKIGWLPLGGYVRFVGDMSPASDPADLESVPPHLRDKIFQMRPVWQRFLVVLAGPAANFLLAILIFAAFFVAIGLPSTPNRVASIMASSAAQQVRYQGGDRILAIAGRSTPTFEDILANPVRPNEQVGSISSVAANGAPSRPAARGSSSATASARPFHRRLGCGEGRGHVGQPVLS